MKKLKTMVANNPFDLLTEEIVFAILDSLNDDALTKKSFSLVCKAFYTIESRHRRTLRALRSDLILRALKTVPFYLPPRPLPLPSRRRRDVDPRSVRNGGSFAFDRLVEVEVFTHVGLASLVGNCAGLVEIDCRTGRS
ncbi:hypothetical protein SLA2020_381820 [Shorea laevis]